MLTDLERFPAKACPGLDPLRRVPGDLGHPGADTRLEPADPAAAHRHRVAVDGIELDQAAVAGPFQPDHALDFDDMAAVDADEACGIEPGLDVADRERAEQLRAAVEDISIMSIGMHRDDAFDRDVMGDAVPFHRKMPGETARRRAGPAERSITCASDSGLRACDLRGCGLR